MELLEPVPVMPLDDLFHCRTAFENRQVIKGSGGHADISEKLGRQHTFGELGDRPAEAAFLCRGNDRGCGFEFVRNKDVQHDSHKRYDYQRVKHQKPPPLRQDLQVAEHIDVIALRLRRYMLFFCHGLVWVFKLKVYVQISGGLEFDDETLRRARQLNDRLRLIGEELTECFRNARAR